MPAIFRYAPSRERQHHDAPPALCAECGQPAKYTCITDAGKHLPHCCDHATAFAHAHNLALSANPKPQRTPRAANKVQPITKSRRTAIQGGN